MRYLLQGCLAIVALSAIAAVVFIYVDKANFDARMREIEQEWDS